MYQPSFHQEHDRARMAALIAQHPLGTWISTESGSLQVNHIPFLLEPERGEHGTLIAHVARANPVWRAFASPELDVDAPAPVQMGSVVVFQGADHYISPSWYPSKQEHGKAVPTWNYAAVHLHGAPRLVQDREGLLRILNALTQTHEAGRPAPWNISDAPADYVDSMLKAIVGIEIPISRWEGKWKTSQNRSASDREGVLAGLAREAGAGQTEAAQAMIEMVQATAPR